MRLTNLSLAFNLVYRKSYLIEKGFIKSWALGYPVDKFGKNYPWWTYSFTEFFTPRLNKNGFKRLDFIGFSPCSLNLNSTSIFYKDNNILGL